MVEKNKAERTVESIQQEYTQLCAKLGHLGHQKYNIESDIQMVNSALRDLNMEFAKLDKAKKQEAEPAKAEESAKEVK